jgi:hypothetical protein
MENEQILRDALIGLLGTDDKDQLLVMKGVIIGSNVPEEEKEKAIKAIDAIILTGN